MKDIEAIESAKAYVALSNAHQLNTIKSMFADNAVYISSSVGRFEGVDAIIEMMSGFFRRFPDVFWEVAHYALKQDINLVEFDFTMSATDINSLDKIERKGLESIQFSDDGKITLIEVQN